MKKLSRLMIVVLVIALLPVMAAAQTTPASRPGLTATQPAGPLAPKPSPNPDEVLFDQPTDQYQGGVSDLATSEGWGAFSADEFVNAEPWTIEKIFVPGWMYSGSMSDAVALYWAIYPDAGGVPGGDPFTGGEQWWLSLAPSDPAVTIGGDYGGDVTLDVVAAQGEALVLPAGTWWFSFFPDLPNSNDYWWYWFFATTSNGYNAQLIDPYDVFGAGATSWTPWVDLGVTDYWDLAFTFEGTVQPAGNLTCGEITAIPRLDPYGRYIVKWLVEAVDGGGEPVAEVAVTADLGIPAGRVVSRTRMSHPNGFAVFHWGSYIPGNWSIDVTDMKLLGYTFVDGPQCTANFADD